MHSALRSSSAAPRPNDEILPPLSNWGSPFIPKPSRRFLVGSSAPTCAERKRRLQALLLTSARTLLSPSPALPAQGLAGSGGTISNIMCMLYVVCIDIHHGAPARAQGRLAWSRHRSVWGTTKPRSAPAGRPPWAAVGLGEILGDKQRTSVTGKRDGSVQKNVQA